MTLIEISELRERFNKLIIATPGKVELSRIDQNDCANLTVFVGWARMEVPRLLHALESRDGLVQISEREVIQAARRAVTSRNGERVLPTVEAFMPLVEAVNLLQEREHVDSINAIVSESATFESLAPKDLIDMGDSEFSATPPPRTEYVSDVVAEGMPHDLPMPPGGFMPEGPVSVMPRPGAKPITRPPKKLSRRDQEIEKRRQSDVTGRDRSDIDYSSIEDPSAR